MCKLGFQYDMRALRQNVSVSPPINHLTYRCSLQFFIFIWFCRIAYSVFISFFIIYIFIGFSGWVVSLWRGNPSFLTYRYFLLGLCPQKRQSKFLLVSYVPERGSSPLLNVTDIPNGIYTTLHKSLIPTACCYKSCNTYSTQVGLGR